MYDYSGLGNVEKRENLLYLLLIKDLLNKETQEEVMDWILPNTDYGNAKPEDMTHDMRKDVGGALAIAALCEWNYGDKEFAFLGASMGDKYYGSVLCGLLATAIRNHVPIEVVKETLIKGHEQQIIENMAQNS